MEKENKIEAALSALEGLDMNFQSFFDVEMEGMIICENCLDNVFDDDENICTAEDLSGMLHVFCCEDCLKEWEKGQ